MAHELDLSNNRANMAYVGETPWHGLGQRLTQTAPLEVWAREAGMDWVARTDVVRYGDPLHEFRSRVVISRCDTGAPLSVVSDEYKVVQPRQIIEFFRDLTELHGYTLETAGCLFNGRKFWALAKCGKAVHIMGQDEVAPYLLLASSLDGSLATVVDPTCVRVVCSNTLRLSIGNGKNARIRVPHSTEFNAEAVKIEMGLIENSWERFLVNVEALAKLRLSPDDAIDTVATELKVNWEDKDPMESSSVLRKIITLYNGEGMGSNFKSSKGTAWGLLNAATEYFDHVGGSRGFERANLTDRAAFKTNLADKLLKLAA
jgi:phage/plasmid-like protein (TIGR03299 family)